MLVADDEHDTTLNGQMEDDDGGNDSSSLMKGNNMTIATDSGLDRPLPSLNEPATYRDRRYALLYIAHLILLFFVTNYIRNINKNNKDEASEDNISVDSSGPAKISATHPPSTVNMVDAHTVNSIAYILRAICFMNLLFSIGWLYLFYANPKKKFLRISCIISTAGLCLLDFALYVQGYTILSLCLCGIAIADIRWILKARNGFNFVSGLLEMVYGFLRQYRLLGYITGGILFVYSVWASWVITTIVQFTRGSISPYSLSMLYMYFHFYWTSHVLKNILTFVVSGTTMMWYSTEDDETSLLNISKEHKMVEDTRPLSSSITQTSDQIITSENHVNDDVNEVEMTVFNHDHDTVVRFYAWQALTSSFGSVCIGALLCPVAHVVWNFLRWAKHDDSVFARRTGGLPIAEDKIEYFIQTYHKFSFVHVAGYGKSFYTAAADSWELLESRGVEAIIDADLSSRLLNLGPNAWACFITAVYLIIFAHGTAYQGLNGLYLAMLCFVLSYTIVGMAMQVVGAVIKTLFVCFAENPSRLCQLDPLIYHRLARLSELKSFKDSSSHVTPSVPAAPSVRVSTLSMDTPEEEMNTSSDNVV